MNKQPQNCRLYNTLIFSRFFCPFCQVETNFSQTWLNKYCEQPSERDDRSKEDVNISRTMHHEHRMHTTWPHGPDHAAAALHPENSTMCNVRRTIQSIRCTPVHSRQFAIGPEVQAYMSYVQRVYLVHAFKLRSVPWISACFNADFSVRNVTCHAEQVMNDSDWIFCKVAGTKSSQDSQTRT